jgi:hypothetical protein
MSTNKIKGKKLEAVRKRSSVESDEDTSDDEVISKPKCLRLKPKNNFQEQLPKIEAYCVSKFGALGDIITTYEYFVPEEIELPHEEVEIPDPDEDPEDYESPNLIPTIIVERPVKYTPENDPFGLKLRDIQTRSEERSKLISEMFKKRSKLYYVLLSLLSIDSRNLVETDKAYGNLKQTKDPLRLWKIITKIHLTGSNHEASDEDQLNSAGDVYITKQGIRESLGEFYLRFKSAYQYAEILDAIDLTPQKQGKLFIKNLDSHRFSTLNTNMKNNKTLGTQTKKIVSLAAAYIIASEWQVITGADDDGAPVTQQAAFVTQNTKGKTKPVVKKGKSKPETPDSDGDEKPEEKKKPAPSKPCMIPGCGEKHWTNECPYAKVCKEAVEKKKAEEQMTNITIGLDSEDEHCFTAIEVTTANSSFTDKCEKLDKGDVLLDNQSTTHIFKDADLLSNIRTLKRPKTINGIGGKVTATKIGHFHPFGNVYLHPTALANILSFARVGKKYDIEYDNKKELFTVHAHGYILPFHEYEYFHKGNFLNLENYRSVEHPISITKGADHSDPITEPEISEDHTFGTWATPSITSPEPEPTIEETDPVLPPDHLITNTETPAENFEDYHSYTLQRSPVEEATAAESIAAADTASKEQLTDGTTSSPPAEPPDESLSGIAMKPLQEPLFQRLRRKLLTW